MDFVLWKPSDADLPGWDSPWGKGRPGWHIECSAMSYELLGGSFDIHGGGLDLQFPHHENEIAQSACAHPDHSFAKVWMHNEMLQVEGKKMSKSLGNFFTVRDLLDQGIPGEVIRMVYLGTHYGKPMDWTAEKAEQAMRVLRKWRDMTDGMEVLVAPSSVVLDMLADDLNTAGAIGELHRLAAENDAPALLASARMLGLLEPNMGDWTKRDGIQLDAIKSLLGEVRAKAMSTRDFSDLDRMKQILTDAGVSVSFTKQGIGLAAGPEVDLVATLEALK
jgi:cysteinyl-tRNA synthetase